MTACGCETITAMTQKMSINVHVVSHVKEKLVHIETQAQAESQKLAEVDEIIAKVSNVQLVILPAL